MSNKKFRRKAGSVDLKSKAKSKNVSEYEISYEPIEDESVHLLPVDVRNRVRDLYNLIQKDPQQVIPELLALKDQYPTVAVLGNYLYVAYMLSGDEEKSDAMMLENYQRHPGYLFAKLTYGQYLLKQDNLKEFEKVFENKFDLRALYPNRRKYHVAEIISFWGVMGLYQCAVNNWEAVAAICHLLQQFAPQHEVTKLLNTRLQQASQLPEFGRTVNIVQTIANKQ